MTLTSKFAMALPAFKTTNHNNSAPAVLKADTINSNGTNNAIIAKGHAEIAKGNSIIYADEMIYLQNSAVIQGIGNVRVKNIEVGNVRATKVDMKDDFSSGEFFDSELVFNDGSYLLSPQITRKNPMITQLETPVYSICPNPDISTNNALATNDKGLFSITSKNTTIDREDGVMKSKHAFIRLYDVPILYTPYISVPLPSKERKSGFLMPSYAKSTNLGLGIIIPYYFNIAPNMELTVSPMIGVNNNQILISNNFRHKTSYGDYVLNLEGANNNTESDANSTDIPETNKEYRFNLEGSGEFDFTENVGLDFGINTVGDRNYLRDYHFDYVNYTLSHVNLDYIKGRNYYSIKAIDIQELEDIDEQKSEPFILPIDGYVESKPQSLKEKYSLASNVTILTREDGLQYRRAMLAPEVSIPLNLNGNLFQAVAKVQGDLYYLKNNFHSLSRDNNYDTAETNYKPEASLSWRLPLIKKSTYNTLMIEPMANIVISSDSKGFNGMPNQDSNDSELTVNNLFISDRISGLDRNETGERINYGVKSSLFNQYGEFALTLGQGYKANSTNEDVEIRGFSNSQKSSIVGQMMYKTKKIFSLVYSFQLNESNYRNDLNQITTSFNFDRVKFSSNYLLIRKTLQNEEKKEQLNLSSEVKLTPKWLASATTTMDLATDRAISRALTISRAGCCTVFGFSVVETNPSDLVKPQKSYNISLSLKNL